MPVGRLFAAALLPLLALQGCDTSSKPSSTTTSTTTTTTTTTTAATKGRNASSVITVPGWPDISGKFPLSYAVKAGGMVYVSGMQGMDMATLKLVPGGVGPETTKILSNLQQLLQAADSSMGQVTLCSVSLVNISRDFTAFNTAYAAFFKASATRPSPPPARVAVQVSALAGTASVEIQCNAALKDRQRPTIVVPTLPPIKGFPLSWATEVDGIVYASGMQGLTASGELIAGGIGNETTQALQNLNEILKSAASDAGSVISCSVWLTNMSDFEEMNEAYKAFWPEESAMGGLPTRVCVEAAALAGKARVEIQCNAVARGDPHHTGPPKVIKVPGWPKMKGFPFSAAATIDNLAFISGNQGVDMSTSKLVEGGAGPETTQTLKDIQESAEAAGTGLSEVVACEVSLTDMKDFAAVNKAYAEFWPSLPPSRVAVQVGKLARDASVEIRCLAAIPAGPKEEQVELVV